MKGYPDNEILAILSVIAALLQFNKKKALEMFKRNFMAAETTCATISTRTTIVQQYTNSEILARLFEIAVILKFNKPKALAMFNKEFGAIYNRRNTQIDTTSLFT